MKKITGVLTPILALAVLILGACPNAAVPDPVPAVNTDLNSPGKSVTIGSATQPEITGLTIPTTTLYNVDDAEFTITFTGTGNFSLDADALLKALEVKELADRAVDAATATSKDKAVPNGYQSNNNLVSKIIYVDGASARILLNLSSLTYNRIEFHVKATEFTANGGYLKLNLDGDSTPGEAGDDDIYGYRTVSPKASSTLKAPAHTVDRSPRAGIGIAAGAGTLGAFSTSTGSTTGLRDRYTITANFGDVESASFLEFLRANLIIEKYAGGAWTALTVNITDTTTITPVNPSSHAYTAAFTSGDRDILRARLTKTKELETVNEYYGYKQKLEYDDNAADVRQDNSGIAVNVDGTAETTPGSSYTYQKYTNSSIATSSGASVISADGSSDVYVSIPLDTGSGITAGKKLTDTTVTADNIKIVVTEENTSVVLPWDSFSYNSSVTSGVTTTVTYPTLLLKMPAGFKKGARSFDVYISPDVKNADGRSAYPDGVYYIPGSGLVLADEVAGTGTL
jgi:hypothetical protein